jgi:hypothetical protein
MTQTYSRARQEAEIAFARAQSAFLARESAVRQRDATADARKENTLALRKARLAKEQEDRSRADTAPAARRSERT